MYFSTDSGRIELKMTLEQARSANHQGQCDADVKYLSQVPAIRRQLNKIDATILRGELEEYGVWDDIELLDHEQNIQRLLWLAATDISEEHATKVR